MSCQQVTSRLFLTRHTRIRRDAEDALEIDARISVGITRTIDLRDQREVGRREEVVSPLRRERLPAVMAAIEIGLHSVVRENRIPEILEDLVGLHTATERILATT